MNEQVTTWSELVPDWQFDSLMLAAMQSTAWGLSGMVERPIEIAPVKTGIIPVGRLIAHAGNPDPETAATMTNRLQVFETVFRDSGKAVQARFWVLPAPLASSMNYDISSAN